MPGAFWIHLFVFMKNTPELKKKPKLNNQPKQNNKHNIILRTTKEYCTVIPLCSCKCKYLAVYLQ